MDVTKTNELLKKTVASLTEKKSGKKDVSNAYYKYFDRVEVNMMSLGKIYKEIEGILASGADMDKKMKALVSKYRE